MLAARKCQPNSLCKPAARLIAADEHHHYIIASCCARADTAMCQERSCCYVDHDLRQTARLAGSLLFSGRFMAALRLRARQPAGKRPGGQADRQSVRRPSHQRVVPSGRREPHKGKPPDTKVYLKRGKISLQVEPPRPPPPPPPPPRMLRNMFRLMKNSTKRLFCNFGAS